MNKTPKRLKFGTDILNANSPNHLPLSKTPNSVEKKYNGSPSERSVVSPGESRRGRPRAELLNTLILEGSSSPSSIKCTYCGRVFPREKSLQAHLRTHTGERPYVCDYPRCTRRFTQSGQLKTHQRLHTGEKPFICNVENCERRFTHANRHCPEHPDGQLKRFISASSASADKSGDDEHSSAVQDWLKNNKSTPSSLETTPRKCIKFPQPFTSNDEIENAGVKGFVRKLSTVDLENSQGSSSCGTEENTNDLEKFASGLTSRSNLFNVKNGNGVAKEHIELPKKRWLREAVQDQQQWDSSLELARPINWDEVSLVEYENQRRPTVLMRVQDRGATKEVSRADMQTAIALVELKNGGPINYRQY